MKVIPEDFHPTKGRNSIKRPYFVKNGEILSDILTKILDISLNEIKIVWEIFNNKAVVWLEYESLETDEEYDERQSWEKAWVADTDNRNARAAKQLKRLYGK